MANELVVSFWVLIKRSKSHFNLIIPLKVIVSTYDDNDRQAGLKIPFYFREHGTYTLIRKRRCQILHKYQ